MSESETYEQIVDEYINTYEHWESKAYTGGKSLGVDAFGKKPNWESLGRKYYELYLKSRRLKTKKHIK